MAEKVVTYCIFDGDPAILVRRPDGTMSARVLLGGEWREASDADVATSGQVVDAAVFRKMLPEETPLPDLN